MSPVAVALLQEWAANHDAKLSALDPAALAALILRLPVTLSGLAPIETAISSAGGIPFEALDDKLMLRNLPGTFGAGEMLDWEAPTGGYLLQAAFATGYAAGRGVVNWLKAGV